MFNSTGITAAGIPDRTVVYAALDQTTADATITVGSGMDYATIQEAIDSLPFIIVHDMTIEIYAGTYSEDLTLFSRIGKGSLLIKSHTGDTVTINSFYARGLIGVQTTIYQLTVVGTVTLVSSTEDPAVMFRNCTNISAYKLTITESVTDRTGIRYDASSGIISQGTISNRQYGILAQNRSYVGIQSVAGTGNTYGTYCTGSIATDLNNNTITGTTPRTTADGGVIFGGPWLIYSDDYSFSNSWADYSAGNLKYKKNGNVVYLAGLIKSGSFGTATTAFTLPAGYRPGQLLIVPLAAYDGAAGIAYINTNGTVCIYKGSTTWTSLGGVSFVAEN
jgi:hypothetical protein